MAHFVVKFFQNQRVILPGKNYLVVRITFPSYNNTSFATIHNFCHSWRSNLVSGVTNMGSDRANPGAPNHNGPNGGPQAQAVEQKHWPGPLICHNVVFWPSEFCKISPQSLGNGISETLDSKIFRMSKPWTPRKLVHIRRSTRAFGTSTRGGLRKFWTGGPLI
jgi:hypothetical protein